MAKAKSVTITRNRIKTSASVKGVKTSKGGKRGNPNRCPTCGRFV